MEKQRVMVLTRVWSKNDPIRSTVERISTTAEPIIQYIEEHWFGNYDRKIELTSNLWHNDYAWATGTDKITEYLNSVNQGRYYIKTTAKLFEEDDEIEEQIYQITFRNLY